MQRFARAVRQGFSRAVDLIVPPRCIISGEVVEAQGMMSPQAWQSLRFIAAPICQCCGVPMLYEVSGQNTCGRCFDESPHFTKARAAVVYDDGSRKALLRFKHGDQTHYSAAFATWLHRAGADMLSGESVLVPVPLHFSRLRMRRYNQAALLTQALARRVGCAYELEALKRVRATLLQGHDAAVCRRENVSGAFVVAERRAERLRGRAVVLVDDVFTSGATVNECARVLLAAGAREVCVLTVARAVRDV